MSWRGAGRALSLVGWAGLLPGCHASLDWLGGVGLWLASPDESCRLFRAVSLAVRTLPTQGPDAHRPAPVFAPKSNPGSVPCPGCALSTRTPRVGQRCYGISCLQPAATPSEPARAYPDCVEWKGVEKWLLARPWIRTRIAIAAGVLPNQARYLAMLDEPASRQTTAVALYGALLAARPAG